MSMKLSPVILAGGGGTRLWPLSREHYPKQFLSLFGEKTLLQETLSRLNGLNTSIDVSDPVIICNEAHRFLVAEQSAQISKNISNIILEPKGRNTAPALTVAAIHQIERPFHPAGPCNTAQRPPCLYTQVTSAHPLRRPGGRAPYGRFLRRPCRGSRL